MTRRLYAIVADRVLDATRELNAAIQEAYDHPQVRVYMGANTDGVKPTQYGCEVTRITKHSVFPARDNEDARLDVVWRKVELANPKYIKPKKRGK